MESDKFNIVVITPNRFNIDSINEMVKIPDDKTIIGTTNKMTFIDTVKFLESIKKYATMVTTNKDNLLEQLVNNLNMDHAQQADTDTCMNNRYNIIQITYITDYKKEQGELDNFIASYLTEEKHGISGNGILVKSFHDGYINGPLINKSVDYDDIMEMLVSVKYKDGVRINIDETLDPILYDSDLNIVNNIFEIQENIKELKDEIINQYGFDMKIYFDENNKNEEEFNKHCSGLLNKKIYGKAYCFGFVDNNYENLCVNDLNDLLHLPYLDKMVNMELCKTIRYYKTNEGTITLKNKYDLLYEKMKEL